MGKPIEKGCRAVIVNSKAGNNGIIVTVGEYLGDSNSINGRTYHHGNRWRIDVH